MGGEPFDPSTMFYYRRASRLWELESFAVKEKDNFGVLPNVNRVVYLGFSLKGLHHLLRHELEDLGFCNYNTCCIVIVLWFEFSKTILSNNISFGVSILGRKMVSGLKFE